MLTRLGCQTTKGPPCLNQWFKLDGENSQQLGPSLFVVNCLIKVEQGLQIQAEIRWDQCLQTALKVTVGRLGVCCSADA